MTTPRRKKAQTATKGLQAELKDWLAKSDAYQAHLKRQFSDDPEELAEKLELALRYESYGARLIRERHGVAL